MAAMSSKTTVFVKLGSKSPSKSLLKSLARNWFAICQPENKVMRWMSNWHAKVVITGQSNTELMGCCFASCFAGALLDTKKKHIEVNLQKPLFCKNTPCYHNMPQLKARWIEWNEWNEAPKSIKKSFGTNITFKFISVLHKPRHKDSTAVWPSPNFTPSKVKADIAKADITLLRPMILYIIMTLFLQEPFWAIQMFAAKHLYPSKPANKILSLGKPAHLQFLSFISIKVLLQWPKNPQWRAGILYFYEMILTSYCHLYWGTLHAGHTIENHWNWDPLLTA